MTDHTEEDKRYREKYPEHHKLTDNREAHEALCAFFDWYPEYLHQRVEIPETLMMTEFSEEDRYASAIWDEEREGTRRPVYLHEMNDRQKGDLIALYFGVDTKAFEAEKEAMLQEMREANDAKPPESA